MLEIGVDDLLDVKVTNNLDKSSYMLVKITLLSIIGAIIFVINRTAQGYFSDLNHILAGFLIFFVSSFMLMFLLNLLRKAIIDYSPTKEVNTTSEQKDFGLFILILFLGVLLIAFIAIHNQI